GGVAAGNPRRIRAHFLVENGPALGIDVADADKLLRGIFRLDPSTSGKGAGPGGTDLGADLGLLGPGEAYQRWKARCRQALRLASTAMGASTSRSTSPGGRQVARSSRSRPYWNTNRPRSALLKRSPATVP